MHSIVVASARGSLHALNRVVSLLRGRDFQLGSLTTTRSETSDVVRLAIVVEASRTRPERVAACLDKLEEVWSVAHMPLSDMVQREVALVKVVEAAVAGEAVSSLITSGRARVVERSLGAAILEIVGYPEDVHDAVGSIPLTSVVEIARLGPLVMTRGSRPTTDSRPPETG